MPVLLSLDVGTRHLGFVIYQTWDHKLLDWGVVEVFKYDKSYMEALLVLEQRCNAHTFSIVVIEQQLRRNVQASRIEANQNRSKPGGPVLCKRQACPHNVTNLQARLPRPPAL